MGIGHFLFFLFGAAGLGYEVVATRLFGLGLGCETASTLAVVTAFMAGIGIGAWMGDGPVRRTWEPARLFTLYQLVFGLWAAASPSVIPWFCTQARVLIGAQPAPLRQWSVAFLGVTLAVLPATAAMGASLQAMEQLCGRLSRAGRTLPGLYAASTAGAVAGILGAALLSQPLGFRRTLLACAVLGLLGAIGSARFLVPASVNRAPRVYRMTDLPSERRLAATLFASGFLGIAFELLVFRALSQVLANTFYTFALTLGVYLLATASGAAIYAAIGPGSRRDLRQPSRAVGPSARRTLAGLVAGLALCCAASLHTLPHTVDFRAALAALGEGGRAAQVASELATTALVLFLPAAFMGATFSHLAQAAAPGRGVGWALAVNTLGGSLAPPLVAVGLVPWIGLRGALAVVSLAYLSFLPDVAVRSVWPAVLAVALAVTAPAQLGIMRAPAGGRLLAEQDGTLATAAVVADREGYRYLKLHSRLLEGGTHSTFGERRMAHIPLLLHSSPRHALCLGVGAGMTVGAAALHPGVMVTGVELHPEVLAMLPFFAPENGPAGAIRSRSPRLTLITSDARRFVLTTPEHYDVIIGDLFHPASDGTAALFTVEHFRAVRDRLTPGGVFCQWLPLHEMDLELVRGVAATFRAVFPQSMAFIAHFNAETPALGLTGFTADGPEPASFPPDWYAARVSADLLPQLTECGLGKAVELFGCLVCDRESLAHFAAGAAIDTDDRERLLFMGPRVRTAAGARPLGAATLTAFLAATEADPRSLIGGADPPLVDAFVTRLSSYLAARDIYLSGDIARMEGRPVEALAAYVESARASPDFAPGFAATRLFAGLLAESHPASARAALDTLAALRPVR